MLATLAAVLVALAVPPGAAADRAYNVLTPGQAGGVPFTQNSRDQLALYDALTPELGDVSAADISRLFKPERLGPVGATTVERTQRRGLTIRRDRFGVPHITGRTQADVWYGVGWVSALDRQLLLLRAREPARAAVADVPALNAFGLATAGLTYNPSAQAEALVHRQQALFRRVHGAKGRQILRDLAAYTAGVNAAWATLPPPRPDRWTIDDSIASTAFIGSIFGNGGGAEAQNGAFLAALRQRLGPTRGDRAFVDLMEADDPEAPTTIHKRFPFGRASAQETPGSPVVDAGSLELVPDPTRRTEASNFLVVGNARSRPDASLAVMGPQLGYFYPEIVLEADLRGPGIRAQGAVAPGSPYILIGRTRDYAWSLTTAQNDNRDAFLEQLCGERRYRYKGRCVPMRRFDAGELTPASGPPIRLTFDLTVHGPVIGQARVNGRPYAVSRGRSTYGRDGLGLAALRDMTLGRGRTIDGFYRSVNQFEFTFNWAYASRRHVAYFSSGRIPRAERNLNELLPRLGTGPYDWKGFLSLREHPHQVDPSGGLLLNWNNKPAPGWLPGDDVHSYGSVHRVELFKGFGRRPRLEDVASVMNRAATQDVRLREVWPVIRAVLGSSAAPDPLTARAVQLLDAWRRNGSSRIDRDLDGRIDDPGAAVMDAAFVGIADAVLRPVLGDLLDRDLDNPRKFALENLMERDRAPYVDTVNGSAFGSGWYGYVDKDLRRLLGRRVRGPFGLRYCGEGSLERCRASLWGALAGATAQLAAAQGPDPAAWRADATPERIEFSPRLLPDTMRWTNRPTFQQVLELDASDG
jgi:acyl-homoserine lactone acylase PvdQ